MPRKSKKAPKRNAAKVEKPAEVEVLITQEYPNPLWVKGVDKNGKVYKVRVPIHRKGKLLHKMLTVQSIDGELEEYYKYVP